MRNHRWALKGMVLFLGSVSLCAQQQNDAAQETAPSLALIIPAAPCTAVTSDGTATANAVTKFTAACNVQNSAITETSGKIGIGTTQPAGALDVKGSAFVRGTLQLPATGTATVMKNFNSQPLDAIASVYNGITATAVNEHWRWQAESAGIGTFNLLFGLGTSTPVETGFSIGSNGSLTMNTVSVLSGLGVGPFAVSANSGGLSTPGLMQAGGLTSNFVRVTSGGLSVVGSSADVFSVDNTGNVDVSGRILICTGSNKNCVSGTVFNADTSGNLTISGMLVKGAGSFKIDHPLDPANRYLYHSFVESPDMMNVYNGNIVTDSKGMATVFLPDYFEALNRDFRYQLTVIGQFAQAIVGQEITGNRFIIKTDKAGVKVSWQVTGIRHDAYADAHRIQVEEDKPLQEQGHYLHPELIGQPKPSATAYSREHRSDEGRESVAESVNTKWK